MTKPWANQNVLFVHAKLDDSGIPYKAMRLLAHLKRRIGKRSDKNPGVRSMAQVCRMNIHTVESALKRLEKLDVLKVDRSPGKINRYALNFDSKMLYVDHRLDDAKLSPAQWRVLMHMARLSDVDVGAFGAFFISERKFAKVCGMKRETVKRALERLEALDFYTAYDMRKNPMYCLMLFERFPREEKPTVQPADNFHPKQMIANARTRNAHVTHTKTSNGMPEIGNGGGPKDATPMPKMSNGGMPEIGNERLSITRYSNEDSPKQDDPREENPAPYGAERERKPQQSFAAPSIKPITTAKIDQGQDPESVIQKKTAEFKEIDVARIADDYRNDCAATGKTWNNKVFEKRVGEAYHQYLRRLSTDKIQNPNG